MEEEDDLVEESEPEDEKEKVVSLNDSIEIEDAFTSEDERMVSSPSGSDGDVRESGYGEVPVHTGSLLGTTTPEGRDAKRRKMSISPVPSSLSHPAEDFSTAPKDDDSTVSGNSQDDELSGIDDDAKALQQPIFQPAPRFKPVSPGPASEGLPAAFSPQRRGARYVSGGLATELQGWLSDVKGWEGGSGPDEDTATMRIVVKEVRPGRRMYLVRSRAGDEERERRFMLAGEGRLTGLGRRAVVGMGSVVVVGRPVWDVELDGDIWTVACDWSIE